MFPKIFKSRKSVYLMQKILTKEEKAKKAKRNQLIIGIILIVIMSLILIVSIIYQSNRKYTINKKKVIFSILNGLEGSIIRVVVGIVAILGAFIFRYSEYWPLMALPIIIIIIAFLILILTKNSEKK